MIGLELHRKEGLHEREIFYIGKIGCGFVQRLH